MKKLTYNKMVKALELLKKAQELLSQVENESEQIRYAANTNFRWHDLTRAISITESDVAQYSPEKLVNSETI